MRKVVAKFGRRLGFGKEQAQVVQSGVKLKEIPMIGENHGQDELSGLRDEPGITLLQVATKKGRICHSEGLVAADPESLECVTPDHGETLYHLALKYDHFGKKMVLLTKHNQEELLNLGDDQGNTLLHIAASKKQNTILKQLLEDNLDGLMVLPNIRNMEGLTALELHSKSKYDPANKTVDKHITELLHKAQAKEGDPSHSRSSLPGSPTKEKEKETMPAEASIEDSSIILQVLFFFVGILFCACLVNFHNIYTVKDLVEDGNATEVLSVKDMIASPKLKSNGFYFVVITTLAFIACMVIVLAITWPLLARTRSPFFNRAVMLFLLSATCVICAFMVDAFVPHFIVATINGSYKISSFLVVCLYDLVLIFIVITVGLIVKLVYCIIRMRTDAGADGKGKNPKDASDRLMRDIETGSMI